MNEFPLLYHTHHQQETEDISFWLAWAQQQGGPILELGCGTGRVLLPLAEAGYSVFGLDHNTIMLEFLRTSLTKEIRKRVFLIRADFRTYCLSIRYPLILMPCNTFSTLSIPDRRAVLNRVHFHLARKGVFVASMPNPLLLADLPQQGESEIEAEFPHPKTDNPVQVSSQWERSGEKVQFHWHYDHLQPIGQVDRQTLSVWHYLQDVDDLFSAFEEAGLSVEVTYGDFDTTPFNPEAPHLIIVAKT